MTFRISSLLTIVLIFIFSVANAATVVHLYGGSNDSVYLGCLNCIETDASSIWNASGNYGSKYQQTSIWNQYGTYGGKYNTYSPFNDYSSSPPTIRDNQGGFYGYLTTNTNKTNQAKFSLAKFIYYFNENISNDVSAYYDLIIKEPLNKYGNVNGMYIYAQDTKQQYLGFITSSQIESESIINTIGAYGSTISQTSIFNTISTYGSSISSYSPFNSITQTPPVIYSYNSTTKLFTAQYYLTKNTLKTPYIDPELLKFVLLQNFNVDWSIPLPYSTTANQNANKGIAAHKTRITFDGRRIGYGLGTSKKAYLSIYNLCGQKVLSAEFSKARAVFDISYLPRGSYIINIEPEHGELIREGIVLK